MIYKKQILFKIIIIFFIISILFFSHCIRNKNPLSLSDDTEHNLPIIPTFHVEPTFNCEYWSIPTEDAFILFFRLYTTIRVDSLIAGAIQYHLDQARTIDNKLINIHPRPEWELGILIVGVSEELYDSFDTSTHRFGNIQLDYLLDEFGLIKGEKNIHGNMIKFYFNDDYNVSVIGNIFETLQGIRYADPNCYGSLPEASHAGVILEIEAELFNFNFYESNWHANNTHNWEIHVIDDHVNLIAEWDESIY